MNDEGVPKSAYELAMERLRKKDAADGVERRELTDGQRAAIAEARNYCESKLAEREVLHHSDLARTADPETRANLDQAYRHDRERFIADREAKIERIRRGE